MMKIHIEDIIKKQKDGLTVPGPGKYQMAKTFGQEGFFKSFSPRLKYDDISLKRQKFIPGPGMYPVATVLSTGIADSNKPNGKGQAWTKANDRFWTPLNRRVEPAPGQYSPKNNLTDESILKSSAKCVVGKQNLDILDIKYHKRERSQIPGPGTYKRFSDFNQKLE